MGGVDGMINKDITHRYIVIVYGRMGGWMDGCLCMNGIYVSMYVYM